MPKTKNIESKDTAKDIPALEDPAEIEPDSVATEPAAGRKTASTGGRKALGQKDPITFRWKLIGRSGDLVITLFKSVERADVDAQLERLIREGYYQDLQIVDAGTKIEQPRKAQPIPPNAREPKGLPTAEKPKRARSRKTSAPSAAKRARKTPTEKPAKGSKPTRKRRSGAARKSSRSGGAESKSTPGSKRPRAAKSAASQGKRRKRKSSR